jgi:TRAP-type uncharacterized transport system fused permease subunit
MGMPTTAAYAIAAAVVAPGLVRIGVDMLTAHMFVFYFAVISAITPPVALASFAAAALAQSDPWKTSFESVRYAIAAFVVPFMFYYHPAILLRGTTLDIAIFVLTACLGILLLALASEGWLRGPLDYGTRALLLIAAALLIAGDAWSSALGLAPWLADVAGLTLGGGIWAMRRAATRPQGPASGLRS